jgi:vacuolar-type H+-ATPase subunit H
MKQVLDSLLSAEVQAKAILQKADADGTTLLAEAKEKSRLLVQQHRDQAQGKSSQILDEARHQAQEEHDKRLARSRDESTQKAFVSPEARKFAVKTAVDIFSGNI